MANASRLTPATCRSFDVAQPAQALQQLRVVAQVNLPTSGSAVTVCLGHHNEIVQHPFS
jgi:hypothetical protein